MKRLVALVLFLAVMAGPARAATNAFVSYPPSPRSAAMGGHLVTLLVDDDAVRANPARLAFAWRGASASYEQLQPDVELWRGRAGLAWPLGKSIAVPLQTSRIVRTAAGLSLDATSLTLIEGSNYGEMSLAGGFAWAPTNIGAMGATVHYERATSDLDEIAAHGWGVDVGFSADLSDHWDAALAIENAFGRAQYDGTDDEDRAARLTIGLATARRRWYQAELDYVFQYDKNAAVAIGGEGHIVPDLLDVRAGLSREFAGVGRTVSSAGLGIMFRRFRLDYAFRNDGDGGQDTQHHVSLGARF